MTDRLRRAYQAGLTGLWRGKPIGATFPDCLPTSAERLAFWQGEARQHDNCCDGVPHEWHSYTPDSYLTYTAGADLPDSVCARCGAVRRHDAAREEMEHFESMPIAWIPVDERRP